MALIRGGARGVVLDAKDVSATASAASAAESWALPHEGQLQSRATAGRGAATPNPQNPCDGFTPDAQHIDLATACLVAGVCRPALESIADDDLQSILFTLGAWLQAQLAGDFRAFSGSRCSDLESADRTHAAEADALRAILRDELSLPDGGEAALWSDVLARFWAQLYVDRPLRAVHPGASTLVLEEVAADLLVVDEWGLRWEQQKSALIIEVGGKGAAHIDHRPVAPHSRTVADVAKRAGRLRWFDWRVGVDLRGNCLSATLLMRMVWDADDRAWFLHDALTVYPTGCDPAVNRSFLLL